MSHPSPSHQSILLTQELIHESSKKGTKFEKKKTLIHSKDKHVIKNYTRTNFLTVGQNNYGNKIPLIEK